MNENDIPVISTEQFATFRQVIQPDTQESVPATIVALLEVYKRNHMTGTAVIHINTGGVRSLTYDQIAKIPVGSFADKAVEELFARQSSRIKKP